MSCELIYVDVKNPDYVNNPDRQNLHRVFFPPNVLPLHCLLETTNHPVSICFRWILDLDPPALRLVGDDRLTVQKQVDTGVGRHRPAGPC